MLIHIIIYTRSADSMKNYVLLDLAFVPSCLNIVTCDCTSMDRTNMHIEPDDFSRMDAQHKQLAELVKVVCQILENSQEPIEFTGKLNSLVKLARFHFAEEEDFMRIHLYEGLEIHKRTHKMLYEKLLELREKTFIFDESSKASLLEFLEEDFYYHIVADKHDWKSWQYTKGLG